MVQLPRRVLLQLLTAAIYHLQLLPTPATRSVHGSPVQTGGTSYTLSNIQAVHTVEVTFRLLEYVVTGSSGANGSIAPEGATTVTYGSDLSFAATPDTGYQVDTWSVDGSPVQTGGTSYTL